MLNNSSSSKRHQLHSNNTKTSSASKEPNPAEPPTNTTQTTPLNYKTTTTKILYLLFAKPPAAPAASKSNKPNKQHRAPPHRPPHLNLTPTFIGAQKQPRQSTKNLFNQETNKAKKQRRKRLQILGPNKSETTPNNSKNKAKRSRPKQNLLNATPINSISHQTPKNTAKETVLEGPTTAGEPQTKDRATNTDTNTLSKRPNHLERAITTKSSKGRTKNEPREFHQLRNGRDITKPNKQRRNHKRSLPNHTERMQSSTLGSTNECRC